MWALLALGTAVLTSFNPILYKRILRDAAATSVVWAVTLLALPLLGFFAIALMPERPALDWLFVLGVTGSAVFNVIAHLASTQALKLEDASLVTPLLVFSPLFTTVFSAILLQEIPSAHGWLSIGLVLLGVYGLNRQPGTGGLTLIQSLAVKPGVMLVILAGLLWAITPLFEKVAIQHTDPESPRIAAFVTTALLTLLLTPVIIRKGGSVISPLLRHRREVLLAGLIAGIAPVLGYTAYTLGLVGYVTTLFKLSSLLMVIWSSLLLKEPGLRRRLPASALIMAGAMLLTL